MTKSTDYRVGDILVLTSRTKRNGADVEEHRGAIVTAVDYSPGYVIYAGHRIEEEGGTPIQETGSGAFSPEEVIARLGAGLRYGLVVGFEKVGHIEPRTPHFSGPRPGDSAYDLMNDPRR